MKRHFELNTLISLLTCTDSAIQRRSPRPGRDRRHCYGQVTDSTGGCY